MKRWTYALGKYSCSYSLSEARWYIFLIEDINDRFCGLMYTLFGWVSLPNIGKIEDEGETYTWKEWWGSCADIWHVFVCTKVFDWCHRRTKHLSVPSDYDTIKKTHYEEDREFFDEWEDLDKEE